MEEKWMPIEGYEGYYEVSNLGRVRSVDRVIHMPNGREQFRKGVIKKQSNNTSGYPTVKLSKDGSDIRIATHILVAKAFVDGWFHGAEVNHIDFDRTNSTASNLEWTTHRSNILHTIKAGRHVCNKDLRGKNNPNYNNHKLHEIYASNPHLSKEKQGRPGSKNGRARKVALSVNGSCDMIFDTIKDCAQYMISNNLANVSQPTLCVRISGAIKHQEECYGCAIREV